MGLRYSSLLLTCHQNSEPKDGAFTALSCSLQQDIGRSVERSLRSPLEHTRSAMSAVTFDCFERAETITESTEDGDSIMSAESRTRPVPGQSPVLTRAACVRPGSCQVPGGVQGGSWRVPDGIATLPAIIATLNTSRCFTTPYNMQVPVRPPDGFRAVRLRRRFGVFRRTGPERFGDRAGPKIGRQPSGSPPVSVQVPFGSAKKHAEHTNYRHINMERSFLGLGLLAILGLLTGTEAQACPGRFKGFNGRCYGYFGGGRPASYRDAARFCTGLGAELFMMRDPTEVARLKQLLSNKAQDATEVTRLKQVLSRQNLKSFWVGLTGEKTPDSWTWSDGDSLAADFLGEGGGGILPKIALGSEQYLKSFWVGLTGEITPGSWTWQDVKSFWVALTGEITPGSWTWSDAAALTAGDFTAWDGDKLQNLKSFWVGLTDETSPGSSSWTWSDGTALTAGDFTAWDGDKLCAFARKQNNYRWGVTGCGEKRAFICVKDP
ncbi:hypothetical protein Bbelb_322320 [Branchiostoma belcheri]|nr:hypothetical protein Bbelb_322320 [Branchiostoma belcheri]